MSREAGAGVPGKSVAVGGVSDPLPLIPPLPDNIDPEVAEALTFAIHRAIRCCDFDDQECEEHVPWVLRRLHEAGFELVKIAKGSA